MKTALIIVGGILSLIICAIAVFLVKIAPAINHAVEMAEKHPSAEIPMSLPDMVSGMEKYDYFCSDGGPFILIPSAIKKYWKGATLINMFLKRGDYWKACKAILDENPYGTINAYGHQIFVVDAPMLATHKESDGDTIFIYALVGWQVDDLDDMIDSAIDAIKKSDFVPTEESVKCNDEGYVFMYAGDVYGDCIYDVKDIPTKAATYNISEAHWKNEGNEVRIFKFSLMP